MPQSLVKQHDEEVEKLQKCLLEHLKSSNRAICLAKESKNSNTTRSSGYKHQSIRLNVEALNRVLHIDSEQMICLCEPRVTMRALAKETLKKGLIPLVVPEFKGITVGGAIMGCGGESSSHEVGLFHDICPKVQLLLGSGESVWASPTEHKDLYDSIGGSYGSLGVLLASEIKLQRALPFVNLTYHRFRSAKEVLEKIKTLMRQKEKPEFLEGILFSKEHGVCIEGRQSSSPFGTIYRDSCLAPWFYQHAKTRVEKVSLPLYDYLFRYDRGAFWMGGYVIHPPILKRVLTELICKIKTGRPFTQNEIARYSQLPDPNVFMRLLSSPFTNSETLYSVLHSSETWVAERFMVQDFTVPEEAIGPFLQRVEEVTSIWPLWLCPIKNSPSLQLFSPHANLNCPYNINVGVYGIPASTQSVFDCTKALENDLQRLEGRKWLYSHSTYSPEQFWQIYPHKRYLNLRDKYEATKVWISIENKVLTK